MCVYVRVYIYIYIYMHVHPCKLVYMYIVGVLATQTKNIQFRENAEPLVMSDSNNVVPTVTSEILFSIHKLFFRPFGSGSQPQDKILHI